MVEISINFYVHFSFTSSRFEIKWLYVRAFEQNVKAPIHCNAKNCQFLRMRRYWTSDHKFLNEGKNVRDEQQSPFAFPSCSQTLSHLQWWKMQKKKAIFKRDKKVKDRHKILQSHNILRRLHVSYTYLSLLRSLMSIFMLQYIILYNLIY